MTPTVHVQVINKITWKAQRNEKCSQLPNHLHSRPFPCWIAHRATSLCITLIDNSTTHDDGSTFNTTMNEINTFIFFYTFCIEIDSTWGADFLWKGITRPECAEEMGSSVDKLGRRIVENEKVQWTTKMSICKPKCGPNPNTLGVSGVVSFIYLFIYGVVAL